MALAFAVIGFVVANFAFSLLAVLLWRGLRRAGLSASWLFCLRMLPSAASLIVTLGIVLPGYLNFEPRGTTEHAGASLLVIAAIAGILFATGIRRAVKSWLETRRMERAWKATAELRPGLRIPVPAYRVPSEMALAALVGVVRPRLYVSDGFLRALLPGERRAMLDHEVAHLHAWDNLKRVAMKVAPDWLQISTAAREIESAWAIAAEEDADDRAAGTDRLRCLELASALIKATRLTPIHCTTASNFCDASTIVRRVGRLLADRPERPVPAPRTAARLAAAITLLGVVIVVAGPCFRLVYAFSEAAVRIVNYAAW